MRNPTTKDIFVHLINRRDTLAAAAYGAYSTPDEISAAKDEMFRAYAKLCIMFDKLPEEQLDALFVEALDNLKKAHDGVSYCCNQAAQLEQQERDKLADRYREKAAEWERKFDLCLLEVKKFYGDKQ